jgi:hypothetical protein
MTDYNRIYKFVEEKDEINIEYGITREMNSGSFVDVYFGEIIALYKDVAKAPTFKDKIRYLIMPPGWSHTGEHKTSKVTRAEFLENNPEFDANLKMANK